MAEMQKYSTQELQRINDAFWQSDGLWLLERSRLPCPKCGALAEITFAEGTFGTPSEIHITCYACKAEGVVAAVEEVRGEFPTEKVTEYVKRYQMGLDSYCDFCRTLLSVQDVGSLEGMSYLVQCPRCSASGQAEA